MIHIEPEWPRRERCGPLWRRGGRRGGMSLVHPSLHLCYANESYC